MPRSRDPDSSSNRQTAGRSADARGETGTDADFLAGNAGSPGDASDMGGIPSTSDAALSPSMSGSSDLTTRGPMDRDRPTATPTGATPTPDRRQPSARQGRRRTDQPARGRAESDGPLEALGKAVSAPLRHTAEPDADEGPEGRAENNR